MRYWLIIIPFTVLIILLSTILVNLFYFKNIDNKDVHLIYIAIGYNVMTLMISLYMCIFYVYFTIFRSEFKNDK